MAKRFIALLIIIIIAIACLAGFKFYQISQAIKAGKAFKLPPSTVSTVVAKTATWQPSMKAVGSVVAIQGVTVSSELPGVVTQIAFKSGTEIKKGALLVKLDISADEAQLKGLQAKESLGKINLARAQDLRKKSVNTPADLDSAQAAYQQSQADVENQQALIAKKVIVAPFAGRLGIRQIDIGQYLPAGTPIVSLQSVHPIYVSFTLPQQDLPNLKNGQEVDVTVDSYADKTFKGKINAINSELDKETRNIQVQATFANSDKKLQPGMFVNVSVLLPEKKKTITLPITAISYNPYGDLVYIVEKDKKTDGLVVRQQFVQVGETRGDQVAVTKGVKVGEQIVTAGQMKLQNKSPVQINNKVKVPDSTHPTPPES